MKKRLFTTLVLLTLFSAALYAGEKKALLIMFDGLRSDVLYSATTPNLDSIRDGSWADGYKGAWTYRAHTNLDSNPSSATNHVAIMTGVTATKNGCFDNGQTKGANWEEYPSFMTRLKTIAPNLVTCWLYNWSEDADIPTAADYVGAPHAGFEGDKNIVAEAVSFLNGTFPNAVDTENKEWKQGTDPDILSLYLDSMDMFGHGEQFSVFNPEYRNKMMEYDAMVGELLAAIKARPKFADEDWLIIVVSDHGGYGNSHGIPGCENCYTIPILVSSKSVSAGRMTGQPQNCDVAAYMLDFFTGSVPEEFDGKIEETVIDPAVDLEKDLAAYFPFDGDFASKTGSLEAVPGNASPDFVPCFDEGGKAISLRNNGSTVSLGKLPELKWSEGNGFSFAFLIRTKTTQGGDPVLVGNKDWKDGLNPGFAVLANYQNPSGNRLFFNLADGKNRTDIGGLDYFPNSRWYFVACTSQFGDTATVYLADDARHLTFVTDSVANNGPVDTGLDWNVGQDGTGAYKASIDNLKFDDLSIWSRALGTDEVRAVYQSMLKKIQK